MDGVARVDGVPGTGPASESPLQSAVETEMQFASAVVIFTETDELLACRLTTV